MKDANQRKTVWRVIPNLDTQELDNLIEEEEEYFNAVEGFEHDLGINQSMLDWHKLNFDICFGNSGEFNDRIASVPQSNKCDDCTINSQTIVNQRVLMMKQDNQLQESHKIKGTARKK